MTVLTGRNSGTVTIMLPAEADEEFTRGLVQAIWQLDHVKNIDVKGRTVCVANDLVPHLKGQALVDTIVEFHHEVSDVLQGMLSLVQLEATRQRTFSHR